MGSNDWYRNTGWNDEVAQRFEAKLGRARRKAQYLRIQASSLARSEPEVALALLERYFQLGDDFDQAQAYVDQATAYRGLGRIEDAVASYEAALRREAEFPNLQTQAYLELPFLIATTPIPARFDQALALREQFPERLMFPIDRFRWNAAYALILTYRDQTDEATECARSALEASAATKSVVRYHSSLGLVGERYPELVRELQRIARGE